MENNLSLEIKYRPQSIEEVWGNRQVKKDLELNLKTGNLSHLIIFSGNVGNGKTSLAYALDKTLMCRQPTEGKPCGHCDRCLGIQERLYTQGEGIPELGIFKFNMGSAKIDEYLSTIMRLLDAPTTSSRKIIIHLDELQAIPKYEQDKLNDKLEFILGNKDCNKYVFITTSNKNNIHSGILSRARTYHIERPNNDEMVEGAYNILLKDDAGKNMPFRLTKEKLKQLASASESPRVFLKNIEEIQNGTEDTFTRIVGCSTVNIEDYVTYFTKVKLGLNAIVPYVDNECNDPVTLLKGLSEFIMTYIRLRNNRDFLITKETAKQIQEVMTGFTIKTLITTMKELENLNSYIEVDSARRRLVVLAYEFNDSLYIQETQDDFMNNVGQEIVNEHSTKVNINNVEVEFVNRSNNEITSIDDFIGIATSTISEDDL